MKKIIATALLGVSLFASQNQDIKVYTEDYPPYNMKIDGKLKGLSVDVFKAVLKDMGSKQSIKDVIHTNWSRAYGTVKKEKNVNTMVFSTTRTESREKLFKWVGPISTSTIGLIALKNKKIIIKNDNDLKKYNIAVVLKDIGQLILDEKNLDKNNIKITRGKNAVLAAFKKLEKNQADMFAYETKASFGVVKKDGIKKNNYEVVHVLRKGDLYFAFNKNTDDKIIKKWQTSLDKIKANGTYAKILKKY